MTIQGAVTTDVQVKTTNVIMESDTQVMILPIMDNSVALKHVFILVDDIKSIAKKIRNIIASYYNMTINTLVDKIARHAYIAVMVCKFSFSLNITSFSQKEKQNAIM